MIKFLLILLLPLLLNASKILSYNIYDRTDRVDVMITFDTPFEGKIKQNTTSSKITIKLEDTSIESTKTKKLSSKFLNSLSIVPLSGYTQIVAQVPSSIKLKASKTADSYGLRLRFTEDIQTKKNTPVKSTNIFTTSAKSTTSSLPTKKTDNVSQSYYIVIAILLIGIIIFKVMRKIFSRKFSPIAIVVAALLTYILAENLPELKGNEYYFHDLMGIKVYTVDEKYLGILTEVIPTGANDVYVIKPEENEEKDILNQELNTNLSIISPQEDSKIDSKSIAEIVFDTAVLFGTRRSQKFLQMAIQQSGYKLEVDGVIGNLTAKKLLFCTPCDIVNKIVLARILVHKAKVYKDPKQEKFLKGWKTRAESFLIQT